MQKGLMMPRYSIFVIFAIFVFSELANAQSVTPISLASEIVRNNIENENEIEGSAQGICLSSGRPGYECSSFVTLGQGICLSSGRPSYECGSFVSVSQGICLSGGRPSYECSSFVSLGQAICLSTGRPSHECSSFINTISGLCLAKGHPSYKCSNITASAALSLEIIDTSWAWDSFYDSSRNISWRCRGERTGQFAEDSKCLGKMRDDDTWPTMNAPASP